jgi:hypothetical protein
VTVVGDTAYLLDGGTSPWAYVAYDLTNDTWRNLPAPPVNATRTPDSRLGPSATDGRQIFSVLTTTPATDHDLVLVAFDPATATWTTLPPPPVRLEPTALHADATSVTVVGDQRQGADQGVTGVAVTFDRTTNTWRSPEASGLDRRDTQGAGGAGREVVWDVSGQVRVGDGTTWHDEPPIPFAEDECGWRGAQTGDQVVLWRCTQQGAVLDLTSGTWSALPAPPVDLSGDELTTIDGHVVLWARGTDHLQPYRLDLG